MSSSSPQNDPPTINLTSSGISTCFNSQKNGDIDNPIIHPIHPKLWAYWLINRQIMDG
jgi:hypothetical protein